jgi:hypothetical protein
MLLERNLRGRKVREIIFLRFLVLEKLFKKHKIGLVMFGLNGDVVP